MRGLFYSIKEGFSGLRRSKLSCILSITTIAISLILIGSIAVLTLNMYRIVNSIRERMELEVFVDNSISEEKTEELRNGLSAIYGIKDIQFVSKKQAAAFFQHEFQQDVSEILDENPFPASFRINFIDEFRTADGVESVIKKIRELSGVDEIVYRSEFLKLLDRYISTAYYALAILGSIVCIGSIFFIYNNIRLVIFARRQLIETMKLVGATPWFIRFPFVIEGIIQAVIGAIVAFGALFVFYSLINQQITQLDFPNLQIISMLLSVGVLLGVFGSAIAVKRFLKY